MAGVVVVVPTDGEGGNAGGVGRGSPVDLDLEGLIWVVRLGIFTGKSGWRLRVRRTVTLEDFRRVGSPDLGSVGWNR